MQMEVKLHLKIAQKLLYSRLSSLSLSLKKNVSLLEEREAVYWTKDKNKNTEMVHKGEDEKKKQEVKVIKCPKYKCCTVTFISTQACDMI